MNINYKEAQFEFFPNAAGPSDDPKRPHFLAARLTLSVENLVILSIVSIMVLLFSFSIGVERGKGLASRGSGEISVDDKDMVATADDARSDAVAKAVPKARGNSSGAKAVTPKPVNKIADPAGERDRAGNAKALVLDQDKKKSAAPSAKAATRPKASGGFTVQVASYKSTSGAEREAASLKQKGFGNVFVVPKGKYVILCIGSFQNKEEADLFSRKKLKSRYQDLRVRSL